MISSFAGLFCYRTLTHIPTIQSQKSESQGSPIWPWLVSLQANQVKMARICIEQEQLSAFKINNPDGSHSNAGGDSWVMDL